MSDFECPKCGNGVNSGDIPDHFCGMMNNQFTYDCECGCSFTVDVDWDQICYVDESSVTFQQPHEAA